MTCDLFSLHKRVETRLQTMQRPNLMHLVRSRQLITAKKVMCFPRFVGWFSVSKISTTLKKL